MVDNSHQPRDPYSSSLDIARKAIPLMSEKKIAVNPRNYTLWYEYFHGKMGELKMTLDEMLKADVVFSEKLTSQLYDRFFTRNLNKEVERKISEEATALSNLGKNTRELLEPVTKDLGKISDNHKDYGNLIASVADRIKDESNLAKVSEIIDAIADKTNRMYVESSEMGSELSSTVKQLNDLQQKLAVARADARIDDLTKISNRRAFTETLLEELAKVTMQNSTSSLAFIDIDRFKAINDTYGHPVGDRALQTVAQIISESIDDSDKVFRVGGEEFGVIMRGKDIDEGCKTLNVVRKAVEEHQFVIRNQTLRITISAGVGAVIVNRGEEETKTRADHALLLAKIRGRNNVKTELDVKEDDVTRTQD